MTAAKTGKAPDCVYHPFQRDNHLGNADPIDPETGLPVTPSADSQPTATYTLRIPDEMQGQCVIRLRYNMSTDDYPSHKYAEQSSTVASGSSRSRTARGRPASSTVTALEWGRPGLRSARIPQLQRRKLTDAVPCTTVRTSAFSTRRPPTAASRSGWRSTRTRRAVHSRTALTCSMSSRPGSTAASASEPGLRGRRGSIVSHTLPWSTTLPRR